MLHLTVSTTVGFLLLPHYSFLQEETNVSRQQSLGIPTVYPSLSPNTVPSPGTISVTSKEMQNAASGPGAWVVCGREHYLLKLAD